MNTSRGSGADLCWGPWVHSRSAGMKAGGKRRPGGLGGAGLILSGGADADVDVDVGGSEVGAMVVECRSCIVRGY